LPKFSCFKPERRNREEMGKNWGQRIGVRIELFTYILKVNNSSLTPFL
jgi:hypothetical protein